MCYRIQLIISRVKNSSVGSAFLQTSLLKRPEESRNCNIQRIKASCLPVIWRMPIWTVFLTQWSSNRWLSDNYNKCSFRQIDPGQYEWWRAEDVPARCPGNNRIIVPFFIIEENGCKPHWIMVNCIWTKWVEGIQAALVQEGNSMLRIHFGALPEEISANTVRCFFTGWKVLFLCLCSAFFDTRGGAPAEHQNYRSPFTKGAFFHSIKKGRLL